MEKMFVLFVRLIEKFMYVFSSIYGWMYVLALALLAYISPVLNIYYSILALIGIDAVFGIWVSISRGKFVLSYLGRETGYKFFFYTCIFMAVHIFETVFYKELNIGLLLCFSILGAFELISIFANALIIKPDLPAIKLFSKFLKGEIANKLHITPEEVEESLKNSSK